MTRRRTAMLAAGLLVSGVPVATTALAATPACGRAPQPAALSFAPRVYIDKVRPGGEPVSVVAQDGSISVSAHGGTTHLYKDPNALAAGAVDFVSTYGNQTLNWRSTDGGRTWSYIGTAGGRNGPHTLTSSGFSDPDYAIDRGGRIYNTEINLANVAVFSSGDDGQTYSRGVAEVTSGDRPWLTAGGLDEVYLYVNSFQQIFRSTDGGITWRLMSQNNSAGPDAKMYIDPLNPDGLIGPHNPQGVAISADHGKTWTAYDGAKLGKTVDFFGAVAVDKAGNVYRAAAGGYEGSEDTKATGGSVTFNSFDRRTRAWRTPVRIPAPQGDMLWPWVVAGDDGRVAVAWLQRLPKHPDRFEMYVAATVNAHGTDVRCKDGRTRHLPPQWTVANASHGPVHVGFICLSGTACNASRDFAAGDRRLGDFYTVNYDKDGRIFVVGGTTVQPGADVQRPTSVPIFIGATGGPKLVTTPMRTRRTRPSCGLDPLC
ncbi:MAG TPA: sialidase family protein [Mycobacteriales bacterium]|nr:sialidase family protein [Mycobacteriales bacterium]